MSDGPPDPAPRPRRRLLFLAVVLASLLVALLLSEVVLRGLGRGPRPPSVNGYFFVTDRVLGWRNRAMGRFEFAAAGSVVTTGPLGERPGIRSKREATTPVVLFVGDSTTFCAEVGDEETGPSEVAKRLPPGADVAVVNAGVRAYGTVQAVRMAEEWLARAPVAVVVYTYADNDFVENVDPIVYLPAWAPVARIGPDGHLTHVEIPEPEGGFGHALDDDQLLPPLNRFLLGAARSSALVNLLLPHSVQGPAIRTMDDGAFGPVYPRLWPRALDWANEHGAGAIIQGELTLLRESCERHGARLLVTRFTTDDKKAVPGGTRELFERACQGAAVQYVDISPAFSDPDSRIYKARMADGTYDAHYGARGTRTYGEALAPRVAALLAPGK